MLKGFESRRPLRERFGLPAPMADNLQGGLRAVPLTGFTSLRTAVANDTDASLEYAQLILALGRPGDLFVGISTSGNAANVCHAARIATARRLDTLALTGEGGGDLANICRLAIRAPVRKTRLVQEHHLPIYHTLCLMLEDAFFG